MVTYTLCPERRLEIYTGKKFGNAMHQKFLKDTDFMNILENNEDH